MGHPRRLFGVKNVQKWLKKIAKNCKELGHWTIDIFVLQEGLTSTLQNINPCPRICLRGSGSRLRPLSAGVSAPGAAAGAGAGSERGVVCDLSRFKHSEDNDKWIISKRHSKKLLLFFWGFHFDEKYFGLKSRNFKIRFFTNEKAQRALDYELII